MLTQARVRQVAVNDKEGRRRFVALERALLGTEPRFVAEIDRDVDKRLRGRSAFYDDMEHALFLAGEGRQEARCAAFLNRRWQRDKGQDAGFIGYFAAAPGADAAVTDLLAAAERWLADRGADRVIAPVNGAAFNGLGTLVSAFDESPLFPFLWQPQHYNQLLQAAGYRSAYPFWLYDVDFGADQYRHVARAALTNPRCDIRRFQKRRWNAEVERLRGIFNETFRSEWEFHAATRAEFKEFMAQLRPVLDPRQFLFAEVDGETVGFAFGLPDWTPLLRSFQGRMGPRHMLRFVLQARRYDRAGLLAIGVRESCRGRHIGQTLAASLYRRYEELGLRGAAYHLVNDTNTASRALAESFGGRGRIVYTVYDKQPSRGP